MTIVLTGGTGLVGQALGQKLSYENYKIHLLKRKNSKDTIYPCSSFLWPEEDSDLPINLWPTDKEYGVIHLAGEPISQWPWTSKIKDKIYNSRIQTTQKLVKNIKKQKHPPSFFIVASAIGIYGEQGNQHITECSPVLDQNLFLQKVCKDWEKETLKIDFCRTAIIRIGLVMSYKKGFLYEQEKLLKKRIRPFVLSSPTHWLSWIDLEDLVSMILWLVKNTKTQGIYNAVSPNPLPLNEFYYLLAKQVKNKTLPVPLPLFLMKFMGGEMTKNIFNSCKVFPKKSLDEGFSFKIKEMQACLNKHRIE